MEPKVITDTLRAIEAAERPADHPRRLAREAIARWRQGSVLDLNYDFNAQPIEQKQIFYNATVRFSRRRTWARWLR